MSGGARGRERGAAFLVVAVLLGLVATLAAGLSLGASMVTRLAGNQRAALEARLAADSGLAVGLAALLPVLNGWRAEGFASAEAALADLLAGGRCRQAAVAAGFPAGDVPGVGVDGGTVRLTIEDDDAAGRGLAAADLLRIGEDGQGGHDANGRLVLRSTAHHPAGAVASVEVLVGVTPLPAVHLAGPSRLGAVTVAGRDGHVEVVGDLAVEGGVVTATGEVVATGPLTGGTLVAAARMAGHARAWPLPPVDPSWWRAGADVVLRADGVAVSEAGECRPPEAACGAAAAPWRFEQGAWALRGQPAVPALVFAEGAVVVASPAEGARDLPLSLAAGGDVTVTGPLTWRVARGGLRVVSGGHVRVEGAVDADEAEGLLAARGFVRVRGAVRWRGPILGRGAMAGGPHELGGGVIVMADGVAAEAGVVTVRTLGFRRQQAW